MRPISTRLIVILAAALASAAAQAQTPPVAPAPDPAAAAAAAAQPPPTPPAPAAQAPDPQAPPAPPPPQELAWRVEQRFRLWRDAAQPPAEIAEREKLLDRLEGAPSSLQIHADMVAFLSARPNLIQQGPWDAAKRAYLPRYVQPADYTVSLGLADLTGVVGRQCLWTTTLGRLQRTVSPCDRNNRLTLPARAGGGTDEAKVTLSVLESAVKAAPDAAGRLIAGTGTIQVADRLIVSLGDSFASGEGNPDVPVNLGALRVGPNGWQTAWNQRWLGRDAMKGVRGTAWLDPACHRSFYNQHLVAALKHAADRRHEAVTFMSYACSGAAVYKGMVVPQTQPPGYPDSPTVAPLMASQLEALSRDLCAPDAAGSSTAVAAALQPNARMSAMDRHGQRKPIPTEASASWACPSGERHVDVVLLSIGGNDVFFGPVIMGTLLPRTADGFLGQQLLNVIRDKSTKLVEESSPEISDTLPEALAVLDSRLRARFSPGVIIQGAYPDPILDGAGKYCGPLDDRPATIEKDASVGRLAAVRGVWPDDRVPSQNQWRFVILQKEGVAARTVVVQNLREVLDQEARRRRWVFVKNGVDRMRFNGWCAGSEQATLPDWNPVAKSWNGGWDPSTWNPYAPRERFFRTPNDAALTQFQDAPRLFGNIVADGLMDDYKRGLLTSLSGSFHPTFQAHVVMGLDLAAAVADALPEAPSR